MELQNFSISATPEKPATDIADLSEDQLLALRAEIDDKLQIGIKNLNLAEELGLQYRNGMKLLKDIQTDNATPANQKAQVFNSVSSMLEKIVKMQESVYSMERLKRIESSVLKAIETLPKEGKEAFFDLYGSFLDDKGC